jgi:hypothetical protein
VRRRAPRTEGYFVTVLSVAETAIRKHASTPGRVIVYLRRNDDGLSLFGALTANSTEIPVTGEAAFRSVNRFQMGA